MTRRPALALLFAVLLLAACGSDSGADRADGSTAEPSSETTTESTSTSTTTEAQPAQARRGIRLVKIGDFSSPLYVTAPRGDRRRVFVVEQGGRIMVVRGGRTLPTPFLDIRSRVQSGGEQGLLSMAFAPDYADSRRFYVYYTDRGGQQRIVEYRRASADRARAGSARTVLRMADPEPNHNGGLMVFGPDGLMYVGTGDGGGANDQHGERGNAQSLGSLLGKLLRIDPRASGARPYRIPSSNPFVGRSGARGEIYSYGLRNPWRFSFDRRTGNLSIGDVGQDAVEEINYVSRARAKGANFGWRPFEGNNRITDESAPAAIGPVITHTHDEGFCSITGGYVVRDAQVPSLAGRYLYADVCEGRIRAARLRSGGARNDRVLDLSNVSSPSSFGEDARGRVYVTSLDGPVYRFAAPRP